MNDMREPKRIAYKFNVQFKLIFLITKVIIIHFIGFIICLVLYFIHKLINFIVSFRFFINNNI
jgi:hypothetical protein